MKNTATKSDNPSTHLAQPKRQSFFTKGKEGKNKPTPFFKPKPIVQKMDKEEEENPAQPIQKKENNTGLPDNLKAGVENLSGLSMDDVQVHYNSSKPAQLNAHAYAQGTDIHVAPGQEKHLPHEAWHVVQQKQGRVQATRQMRGKVAINDDAGLEREADVMGKQVFQQNAVENTKLKPVRQQEDIYQLIIIPLDDVEALKKKKQNPSAAELSSAQIITNAVDSRKKATNEGEARTWDKRFRPFKMGPLHRIGNEEIRIFGHGGARANEDFVIVVGGYTPKQLANALIEMGLQSSYAGQIYITGCKTAAGDNAGFLGLFYNIIKQHAPGLKVKGNLGNAITLDNGKQAVFKSTLDRDLYESLRNNLKKLEDELIPQLKAFNEMPAPTTQAELAAKQSLRTELVTKRTEIGELAVQLRDIHYFEETDKDVTLVLPDDEGRQFQKHVSIQELLAKTENLMQGSIRFAAK